MTTGFVFHERYLWHDTGSAAAFIAAGGPVEPDAHVESPASKRRLRGLLEVSGALDHLTAITPREAEREELLRFHTPEYVDRVEALSTAGHGDAGELAPVGADSDAIARLAVGGCITAVDAVLDGAVDNAYALTRPPGHHAERDRGRGFCLYGNVALAVLHARATRGLGRVAIVDWDVHHGNGTEQAFYDDPEVLTISLHQDGNYPQNTGGVDDVGVGAGAGFNLNVPLPPGSGVGAYDAAFTDVVEPAIRAHRPELIVAASGYDSGALDPMGRMLLHSEAYRSFTARVMTLAGELCDGRLVVSHEGGYSGAYVPFCGLAVVEQLAGVRTGVKDPFLSWVQRLAYQDVQAHQQAVIDRAARHVAGHAGGG